MYTQCLWSTFVFNGNKFNSIRQQLFNCGIINNFLLVSEYYFGCKNKCLFSCKVLWDGTYPHNTLNDSTLLPFPFSLLSPPFSSFPCLSLSCPTLVLRPVLAYFSVLVQLYSCLGNLSAGITSAHHHAQV